jgi:SPX domain protein involved in polyphosphate accumulation
MTKNPEKDLRQELKFLIPAEDRYRALCWIWHSDAGFYREYPDRQVNNIYFDSYNYDAYGENLSGTTSRKKIRYRWYGLSLTPTVGAMELKYKRNYFNWKRVHKINEIIFCENASWHSIRRELMLQLPRELCHHLQQSPVPVLVNRYQRSYFRSRENGTRITLDTGLSFYKQGRVSPNFTRKISLLSNIILEVKFPIHLKNQVLELMSGFPFPLSRCSKYCVGVRAIG